MRNETLFFTSVVAFTPFKNLLRINLLYYANGWLNVQQ